MNFAKIAQVMSHLPNHYLKISCEQKEEESILCATLMERPPEGGWKTRGHYFRHPLGATSWTLPAEPYEDDDACRCAVTAELDGKGFDRNIETMLLKEIEADHDWKVSMNEQS